MIANSSSKLLYLVSVLIVFSVIGCIEENYFGPYQLSLPTPLNEDAIGHTFRLPLDQESSEQLGQLQWCLENREDPHPSCLCHYPVMTIGKQEAQIDYRLSHMSGPAASVMVWIGRRVAAHEVLPNRFENLPQIEVLAEHHHYLDVQPIDSSFLEEEMTQIDDTYRKNLDLICRDNQGAALPFGQQPAPYELIIGMSLDYSNDTQVDLEYTVAIRPGE
jgi:hypothetical protein